MSRVFRAGVVLLAIITPGASARAADPIERLRTLVEQATIQARGHVGVMIRHLESGTEIAIDADQKFPMASTFKLPVLAALYDKATRHQLDWDETIDIGVRDRHLGSGDLSYLYDPPGIRLSLHNVANLMMMVSDNSAADICLARAGAANVNALMSSLGARGIHVDRPTQELILDYLGRDTAALRGLPLAEIQKALDAASRDTNTVEARFARDDRFAADARDQATPRAFVTLLEHLWRGDVVDRASSAAILETMTRCRTGAARLRGLLPPTTVVAHKTGTIGGVVNDVGIIYLPDEAGHVAVAVLSRQTRATEEEAERVIAQVARFAYDYFTFATPKGRQTEGGR